MHVVVSPSMLILVVALEFFFESFVSLFWKGEEEGELKE